MHACTRETIMGDKGNERKGEDYPRETDGQTRAVTMYRTYVGLVKEAESP